MENETPRRRAAPTTWRLLLYDRDAYVGTVDVEADDETGAILAALYRYNGHWSPREPRRIYPAGR